MIEKVKAIEMTKINEEEESVGEDESDEDSTQKKNIFELQFLNLVN